MSKRLLIDAVTLEQALRDEYITEESKSMVLTPCGALIFNSAIDFARQAVREAELVDVAEMANGRWIEVEPKGWSSIGYLETARIACSECHCEPVPHVESSPGHGGTQTSYKWIKTKHCPNCGAKMLEKEGAP